MNLLNTLWLGFRATLFWIGFAIVTMVFGLLSPLLLLLPNKMAFGILIYWTYINVWWLKVTCGVRYTVKNPENIDRSSAHIVLANHQSTWETMAIPTLIPRFAWVLKKELFKIPFFGWALKVVTPIAIDRSAGRSAVDQIKEIGQQRLDDGMWICMFPEGTRVMPGKKGRYKMGGAILASHTGYPVIPIAHNAGESWPRHSYIKKPGTITISVGPEILTEGRKAADIMKDVETWIEAEKKILPPIA
ncbi:MAG TPA: 1-acyl-sn-glycerol-3-phosphate acyltransferase [Thiothrix sp.]|nr:1-acyl-sn-glycerol-3-phosphate acyltransferase [Thiothrix sp.]